MITWCGWRGQAHSGIYTPCDIAVELHNGFVAGTPGNFQWDGNWIASWNAVRDGSWWLSDPSDGLVFHLHDLPNMNRNDDILLDGWDYGFCNTPGCSYLLGQAQVLSSASGEIKAAYVYMNNDRFHMPLWAYTTPADSGHYRFTQVLAHELGHAVGEAHSVPGPNTGRVMECGTAKGENLGIPLDSDTTYGGYHIYALQHTLWGSGSPPPSCTAANG